MSPELQLLLFVAVLHLLGYGILGILFVFAEFAGDSEDNLAERTPPWRRWFAANPHLLAYLALFFAACTEVSVIFLVEMPRAVGAGGGA